MSDYKFWLDDVCCEDVGIYLQKPIEFSAAEPRAERVEVPGRNGDLHIYDGSYKNRTGKAECYALVNDVSAYMANINDFLFSSAGYQKLHVSDDPNHFWEARIANASEIASRVNLLNPFTIEFDCKPFRRLIDGEEITEITNGGNIYNPSKFEAEPYIYFTSTGEGYIQIGYNIIDITQKIETTAIAIIADCETWTVYPENDVLFSAYNKYISCDHFPVLSPGNNTVSWSGGVSVIAIKPRWRTL